MLNGSDKYELFNKLKLELEKLEYKVSEFKEINYGLQFLIEKKSLNKEVLRIYQSKKGTKVDLSLIKDNYIMNELELLIGKKAPSNKKGVPTSNKNADLDITSLNNLIGTDESGKGDFFGPLVIAAVYVNDELAELLRFKGVLDSKKLSDSTIQKLAPEIKKLCKHATVVIGNEKYNELYLKMENLNKLLAWGHARAIENLLEKVECNQVLSDQFGDEKLIKNALMKNGKNIDLIQRTKAEENIAVAAASILARYEFITRLEKLSQKYHLKFPKGASTKTIEVGKSFIRKFGSEELAKVSKLHFKTTEQVKGMSNR